MAAHKKFPLLLFTVFTVIVNAICWIGFTLCDWAMEKQYMPNELSDNELVTAFILIMLVLSMVLPIIFYFLLEKHFVSEKRNNLLNSFFQILIWAAVCIAVSLPICNAVNNDKWIIYQHHQSEFINLNGLEYFIYPFLYAGTFTVFVPLIKLIRLIVRKIKDKHNQNMIDMNNQ